MKTKDVPAIVMLLAGAVYCLFGIINKIPLTEFLMHLLIILLIFWVFGGIVKIVLDRFIGEIEVKKEEEDSEEPTGEDSDEESDDTDSVREMSRENE
ncbi:MAG: hypothetical protein IJO60_08565 [Agathobacter sp.]|nr:hypothetical protein [Agathobacter sp.]